MPLSNEIKEKVSLEVIKVLVSRFDSFPEDASNNRNAPFHEAFLNAFSDRLEGKVSDTPFFISLSSWLQGLNTTLGQSFFEHVAHHLCGGEKREYTSKKLGNLKVSQQQRNNIAKIIADISNGAATPNLQQEDELLFQRDNTPLIDAFDFSADVYFETDMHVVAIELKSVKPNSGEMRGEKQKILEGKAALYHLYPHKKVQFYIGFPFDPTVDPKKEDITSFSKSRFLDSIININKFFASDETLVASELWDFLANEKNTMEELLEIINTISTPSFLDKYKFLVDTSKRETPECLEQLKEWNLFSEIELIENDLTILVSLSDNSLNGSSLNSSLIKVYHKMPFKSTGEYNWERYYTLKKLMD
ncbi:MAG: TdeIII family type II restriction endonuclease [Prevotellaceae bacterium]|jgi:hypothetical protein|nr:TdeIII family type II restriction endonuclease [Prevotellaceae bacterium]